MEKSKIFYITSHGMAGDHWFDWLPKAINSHMDILVLFGESVRAKYLKERTRKERPDIVAFTNYLEDIGANVYGAVGECFAYRAYQLPQLMEVKPDVRWINVVRHPYAWLHFYVTWRAGNMNMTDGTSFALEHEWNITKHEEFEKLPLRRYEKKDAEIWSAYQGMHILNRMTSDLEEGVINIPMERIIADRNVFQEQMNYLTHGKIKFDAAHLDMIYSQVNKPFRSPEALKDDVSGEYESWENWKKDAFDIIVKKETKDMFKGYGYQLS